MTSNRSSLEISGRTIARHCDALLLVRGSVVDRAPVTPEGEFTLRFRAPAEGEYPLCIAVEAPNGPLSPCLFLTYHYDATPPGVLRLLAPTMPEVSEEIVTIRGRRRPVQWSG